jgi:hypothetical protein
MNYPPMLLRLNISGKRRFSLWLVLLAALILRPFVWGKLLLLSGPMLFGVLCALRGLELELNQGNRLMLVSFR